MNLKELYHNKWVRFGFWSVLYMLWVIWLENYWWLLGLIPIYDGHITHKVKWIFWKKTYKQGEKKNVIYDWIDAIIFAVVVVTFINIFFFQAFTIPSSSMESTLYTGDYLFVNKLAYGPRIPQTPLTIPFTHNVIGESESYSTLIQNDYRRLKGFGSVQTGDIVVFGFPHGDTVMTKAPAEDYYTYVRNKGREWTERNFGPLKVRPMDKKDHYVKRCVAVAGDTLEIINGYVYINGNIQQVWPGVQYTYTVVVDEPGFTAQMLDELRVNPLEVSLSYDQETMTYQMPLTQDMLETIRSMPNVISITKNIDTFPSRYGDSYLTIFPFDADYKWTRDNYGPLWIPAKGSTVTLTEDNLPIYRRIITSYEGNSLEVKDGKIFINGNETATYTFAQDYYFMMGDNRHNSLDSRYWGFVPEDHVVGKPFMIWLSIDRNKAFPSNIRWDRIFKFL